MIDRIKRTIFLLKLCCLWSFVIRLHVGRLHLNSDVLKKFVAYGSMTDNGGTRRDDLG